MKRIAYVVAIMFLVVMVVGCASTSAAKFGIDDTSRIKGKTESQIINQFGEPHKKYITSDGDKVLEYRQPTQKGSVMNTMVAINSFGMLSGENSAYVDIMKVYLKDDIVTKATYEENVQGLTMPGR